MLGCDQALNSSSSSLSYTSETDEDDERKGRGRGRAASKVFVKHIRKCFIATDDNGYCEQAILPDLKVFSECSSRDMCSTNNADYLRTILSRRINAKSYEYVRAFQSKESRGFPVGEKSYSTKFMQRMNSSTASANSEGKFDSLPPTEEDPSEEKIFVSDLVFEMKKEPVKMVPVVSPLTILINESSNEKNPFLEYLKHEAYVQDPNQFKKFRIFLPMCNTNVKNAKREFIIVNVLKTARICELIGLICCKYINEKRTPTLTCENVNGYYLKIADDTGEVEMELAPLESSQKVGRFGFNDLALVEKGGDASDPNSPFVMKTNEAAFNFPARQISVVVNFTDDRPRAILHFDSDNIPMEKIFEEILKIKLANTNIFCPKIAYRLEHVDQPGTAINIAKTFLNDFKTNPNKYEFYFFRENSVRKQSPKDSPSKVVVDPNADLTKKINETYEYELTYLSKWRKVPFKIEISKDNLELEEIKPVEITKLRLTSKLSNFYTIPTKMVVSCGYLREKEIAGKSQIRIIVVEEEPGVAYKHLDFECEPKIAEELIKTFNQFFLFCNSSYWKAYNQSKKKSVKWSRRLFNSERLKQQQNSLRRSSLA